MSLLAGADESTISRATDLPHTAQLSDVLGEVFKLLLRVPCLDEVVCADISESEQPVWKDLSNFGMEVVNVFLI